MNFSGLGLLIPIMGIVGVFFLATGRMNMAILAFAGAGVFYLALRNVGPK